MQISLLGLALFIQAPEVSTQETPQPILVLQMPDPVATIGEFLHGPLHETIIRSELWTMAQALPEFSAAELGWNFFLKPAGGDAALAVASFAGDGLYLFVSPGLDGEADEGDWVLIGLGHDGDLAQDCFMPPLQLKGIERSAFRGENWEISIGEETTLMRRENRFLVGSNLTLMHQWLEVDIAELALKPGVASIGRAGASDIFGWIDGEALRNEEFTDKPNDAGASYLVGDLHEALRTAPWAALRFDIQEHTLLMEFIAPAGDAIRDTHAPYFPEVLEIPMPNLEHGIGQGVFSRDLAEWWAGRADFLTERGLAETIEGDGLMKVLFARDPAADVFQHLESEIRWLVAPLSAAHGENLSLEYPAAAMGVRFKENAPEDLEQAFANAYLSAIAFANFDIGSKGQPTLEMNVQMEESGKIYSATYPEWTVEGKKPERYNLSPSMLVMPNGELWISSSLGLLEEIASAPVKLVSRSGMWFDFQMNELAQIIERDRPHLVANRMLEEGGDLEAAEKFTDFVFAAIQLIDGGGARSFLDQDRMHVEMQLRFVP